jgi:hypothetical protein
VPYISGYKPAKNYQEDLRTVVLEQLTERRVLREVIAQSVLEVPAAPPHVNPDDVYEDIPAKRAASRKSENAWDARPPVDYVKLEAQNIALGLAGEKFVIDLERARLERAGKGWLAAQVKHISVESGDGLGYDILSFEKNSREILIEVKTTKYGEYTPFYVSRNELQVSREEASRYHLYRVHSFGPTPRLFAKQGALDDGFSLDAATYIARVS